MKRKVRPNALEAIRWTINHASKEFGADKKTISKKLSTFGIPAGKDKCFSTYQIFTALNGDAEYKAERLRKLREEADRVQDENANNRLICVEKREVYKFFDLFLTDFRAKILSSPISQDEKDEILKSTIGILDGSLEQYIRDARARKAVALAFAPDGETDSDAERGPEPVSES